MARLSLNDIVEALPEFEVQELSLLASAVKAVRKMKESTGLSLDPDDDEMGLCDWAQEILEDKETYELTLADQALLASLVMTEVDQRKRFSSPEINKEIEELGRPRVAHITSAISVLTDHDLLLVGEKKQMSLSPEGKIKARRLIGKLRREAEEKAAEADRDPDHREKRAV